MKGRHLVTSYPPKRAHGVAISTRNAPFVRSNYPSPGRSRVTHRVRFIAFIRESDGRLRPSPHTWCGMMFGGGRNVPAPPTMLSHCDGPICGTCEGRARGAGQIPQASPPLVFSPEVP